jgi:hypothetical protein
MGVIKTTIKLAGNLAIVQEIHEIRAGEGIPEIFTESLIKLIKSQNETREFIKGLKEKGIPFNSLGNKPKE